MHAVRVYLNRHEGAMWWAEDELGFTGGADRLVDLLEVIHEWAGCEGVPDELAVRFMGDVSQVPDVDRPSVTGLCDSEPAEI